MKVQDLVLHTRTCRRFYQDTAISLGTLTQFVDLGRLSTSGGNFQPLRYILSSDPETNALIFPHLAWAMHLKHWKGPAEGERPSAYVVLLKDTEVGVKSTCDHAIAAHSILLGATEEGLAGCMIAGVNRKGLAEALDIPDRYEILLVVALGKPRERIVVEDIGPGEDTRYWRDDAGVHHVPKRRLEDVIIGRW